MRIRYRAQALRDIEDIFRYLNERSPRAADNVSRAIYAGIHLGGIHPIAEQPFASQRTDDPDIRVKSMPRYRYRIFYSVVDEDTVEIIHLRHTSGRPWIPLAP